MTTSRQLTTWYTLQMLIQFTMEHIQSINQSINQSIIFRVALVAMPLLGHYGCYSKEMSHDNVWE